MDNLEYIFENSANESATLSRFRSLKKLFPISEICDPKDTTMDETHRLNGDMVGHLMGFEKVWIDQTYKDSIAYTPELKRDSYL